MDDSPVNHGVKPNCLKIIGTDDSCLYMGEETDLCPTQKLSTQELIDAVLEPDEICQSQNGSEHSDGGDASRIEMMSALGRFGFGYIEDFGYLVCTTCEAFVGFNFRKHASVCHGNHIPPTLETSVSKLLIVKEFLIPSHIVTPFPFVRVSAAFCCKICGECLSVFANMKIHVKRLHSKTDETTQCSFFEPCFCQAERAGNGAKLFRVTHDPSVPAAADHGSLTEVLMNLRKSLHEDEVIMPSGNIRVMNKFYVDQGWFLPQDKGDDHFSYLVNKKIFDFFFRQFGSESNHREIKDVLAGIMKDVRTNLPVPRSLLENKKGKFLNKLEDDTIEKYSTICLQFLCFLVAQEKSPLEKFPMQALDISAIYDSIPRRKDILKLMFDCIQH